ncbi:MAG TPA: hypothetical protein DGN59_19565, partial [Candidatus Latescibacteria bacterium]|nr:hypothetical protein [Candidatus Latescibacterota bacterium]
MNRKTITLLLAICLCLPVANAFGDGHEGGGDHPPMLVIMPPPDTEKPEGVDQSMTGDPEQDFGIVFDTFFGMMDQDGNGELNMAELRAWVHPGPGPGGPGMGEH